MTNTPENRHALETMARLANTLNTGYQVFSRVTDNKKYVVLDMYCPGDTDQIAYPAVYFCDAFVDESGISFEIIPNIYGDHSREQTRRMMKGFEIAMELVDCRFREEAVFLSSSAFKSSGPSPRRLPPRSRHGQRSEKTSRPQARAERGPIVGATRAKKKRPAARQAAFKSNR